MNDTDRKLSGLTAIGIVTAIEGKRARVKLSDGRLTPPIRWGVPYAGSVNTERVPSINEQVVMINTCSGDSPADLIIICSLHCPAFPAPTDDHDCLVVDTGRYISRVDTDGVESVTATDRTINTDSVTENTGAMVDSVSGSISQRSQSHSIKSVTLTIDADVIAKLKMTVSGAFSGIGGAFSKALSIAGISFGNHTHKENDKGQQTGGPQ